MTLATAQKMIAKIPGATVEVKETRSKLNGHLLYQKVTATVGEWRLRLHDSRGQLSQPRLEKLMGGEWKLKMAYFDSVTEAIEWFEDTVVPHA